VVTLIPPARESHTLAGAVTLRELAEIRVYSVVMQSVGLPFMAEKTGVGGKPGVLAISSVGIFATVRPQVGIQVFAVGRMSESTTWTHYETYA